MKFKVGDLIKWYELYDDVKIAKDAGLGIIISSRKVEYPTSVQYLYNVYRSKNQDVCVFEEYCLQKVNNMGETT